MTTTGEDDRPDRRQTHEGDAMTAKPSDTSFASLPPLDPYESGDEPAAGAEALSRKANTSLVLGILGIVLVPLVCSALALAYGYSARRDAETQGVAAPPALRWGIMLGWVGLVLGLAGLVTFALLGI
jgi:hypothetical protein